MSQNRSGVVGYAGIVVAQILAFVFVVAERLVYAGNAPEWIYNLNAAAMLMAFWGSPIITLVGIASQQIRTDPLGRRAMIASIAGTILMYLALAIQLSAAFRRN